MKSARLSYLAHVVTFAMLFQSAAYAAQPSRAGKNGKEDCLLEPGQAVPVLDINSGGEISVNDNSVTEKPWSSKSFESNGKVQLVQYISANLGAVRQNKPFNDALKERRYSSEQLETTIIVHMADTMSLVKGLVVDKMAKNKVKHETINFVIDKNAVGLQRWGMKNKSYAVIVLDANGKVLFAKDGPLSEREVESTIQLIEQQII